MKISLDAGALCVKGDQHFGNYTFTQNLIEGIYNFDKLNEYFIYSFCNKPDWLRLRKNIWFKHLRPVALWLSARVSIEEMKQKKDIFLALNQAIPLKTRSRVIAISHGLSYYFYPQFYPDSYHALKDELETMVKKSDLIIVASRKVKSEMQKLFPLLKNIITINYGVPLDMIKYEKSIREKYFLFCGMNNKIKNVEFVISCFKKFREIKRYSDFKLILVGPFAEYEDKNAGIEPHLVINREVLRKLFCSATAYLSASVYESFNFPVLEALAQNCPVIGLTSSIIPEFNPYVRLANQTQDFIDRMTDEADKPSQNNFRKKILNKFSWEKYVKNLTELYQE